MMLRNGPTPPPSAYTAHPLSVSEIDAHPDADRIWATILAMREEYDESPVERFEQCLRVVCYHLELPQSEDSPCDDSNRYDTRLAKLFDEVKETRQKYEMFQERYQRYYSKYLMLNKLMGNTNG